MYVCQHPVQKLVVSTKNPASLRFYTCFCFWFYFFFLIKISWRMVNIAFQNPQMSNFSVTRGSCLRMSALATLASSVLKVWLRPWTLESSLKSSRAPWIDALMWYLKTAIRESSENFVKTEDKQELFSSSDERALLARHGLFQDWPLSHCTFALEETP